MVALDVASPALAPAPAALQFDQTTWPALLSAELAAPPRVATRVASELRFRLHLSHAPAL